jgi:hypothetical protein
MPELTPYKVGSTPSNANNVFEMMRPVSKGSGIGGMFNHEQDEMGMTMQANAGSPIK